MESEATPDAAPPGFDDTPNFFTSATHRYSTPLLNALTTLGGMHSDRALLALPSLATLSHRLFGWRVALEGDTLVIGARGEDSSASGIHGDQLNNSAPDGGAMYVLVRSVAMWSQRAYLKGFNTRRDDELGKAVAIENDTLIVGSPRATRAGVVYHADQNTTPEHDARPYPRDFARATLAPTLETSPVGALQRDASRTWRAP